ncbi:ABC transporter substrate-binding protein [Georgenia alba]|uniref:ABC transporter substrate-binding protein n=1 Tax=Georgenia alba TaxID=2233858 RepID=A0ABW2Q7N0_9MICO
MSSTPKHVRRSTALLCAATALSLVGCSGFVNQGGADGTNGGTASGVTAYVSTEQGTGLETLVGGFEEESATTLDLTSAETADLNQQLTVQLGSGTAPDLFRVSPGDSSPVAAGVLGSEGTLLDLSEEPWVDAVDDDTADLASVDGNLYGFPVARNSLVMAYNVSIFEELDLEPPTTWSELLDVSQAIEDSGRTAQALGLADGAIYLQFYVYALAGTLLYGPEPNLDDRMRADEVNFADHPGWTEVFEKYLELRDRGFFTEDALGVPFDQAMQDLATGEAGMMLLTNSSLPQVYGYAPNGPEDIGIFAMPADDDADATLLPTAPDYLAVNAEAENPEGARAFLEYLARPRNVGTYADALSVMPGLDIDVDVSGDQLEPLEPLVDEGRIVPYANYLWPNGDVQQTMLQSGAQLHAAEISVEDLLTRMDQDYDQGTP